LSCAATLGGAYNGASVAVGGRLFARKAEVAAKCSRLASAGPRCVCVCVNRKLSVEEEKESALARYTAASNLVTY